MVSILRCDAIADCGVVAFPHSSDRMPMPVITNIEDLRVLAERRVPRMFYDYADSGSWT